LKVIETNILRVDYTNLRIRALGKYAFLQVQKAKSHTLSLIYEDRSNTKKAVLRKIGHTKGRSLTREEVLVKEGS
jgi:hypothetical protein